MRRVPPLVGGLVLTLAALTVHGPAHAAEGSAGCVTRAEYRQVRLGATPAAVHRLLGTAGQRVSRASSGGLVAEVRSYPVCRSLHSTVTFSYRAGPAMPLQLAAKSAWPA